MSYFEALWQLIVMSLIILIPFLIGYAVGQYKERNK